MATKYVQIEPVKANYESDSKAQDTMHIFETFPNKVKLGHHLRY